MLLSYPDSVPMQLPSAELVESSVAAEALFAT
jgi:hypothetical protein